MAHFIPIGLCSGPMPLSSTLASLLSGLPALLLSAHFAWALAEPDLPWNADLLRNTGALVMSEFFLVHATGTSLLVRGRFGRRGLVAAALAGFYLFFLAGFAAVTSATWALAPVGVLIGGRLVAAVLSPDAVPSYGRIFVNVGLFVGILMMTARNLPLFAALYFAAQFIREIGPLLRPASGADAPADGWTRVGNRNVMLRYTDAGLEVVSGRVWSRGAVVGAMGAIALAMGLTVLVEGRNTGLAIGFGLIAGIAGMGLLLFAITLATSALRVEARQGRLDWIASAWDGAEAKRGADIEAVGRLHSTFTESEGDRFTCYALRLGDDAGRPWIDGFATREDAEALGKMIAGELRYGPKARDAIAAEPDVAALLRGGAGR